MENILGIKNHVKNVKINYQTLKIEEIKSYVSAYLLTKHF